MVYHEIHIEDVGEPKKLTGPSLQDLHPELAKYWCTKKNCGFTMKDFGARSTVKVWWICQNNEEHLFLSIIAARVNALRSKSKTAGCPYCRGLKASSENSVASNKLFAREWMTKRNGRKASEFTLKSNFLAWWKCSKCKEEWQSTVHRRTVGDSVCPGCSRKKGERNSLLKRYPELAKQWHPTRNRGAGPEEFTFGSKHKAWWQCSYNKDHVWQAVIKSRVDGRGCPFCRGLKVSKSESLLATYPAVAKTWHPTKNGDLKPTQFPPFSGQTIWWICKRRHEWTATIATRAQGHGCPKCVGTFVDEACKEAVALWHPGFNGNLDVRDIKAGSQKSHYWRCKKLHVFRARVSFVVRALNNGREICPSCLGRVASREYNLKTECPEAAKMWDKKMNGTLRPTDVTPKSPRYVHWICYYDSSHKFQSGIDQVVNAIINRTESRSCPHCRAPRRERTRYDLLTHAQKKRKRYLCKQDFIDFHSLTPESARKLIASLISESRLAKVDDDKYEVLT